MTSIEHGDSFSLLSFEPIGSAMDPITWTWTQLCAEAIAAAERDPVLIRTVSAAILYHASFGQALAHRIAQKLGNYDLGQDELLLLVDQTFLSAPSILAAVQQTWPPSRTATPAMPNS